jgi:surfactin synthase thioesterase subunit
MIPTELMHEWFRHTEGSFELRIVPGDHFFLSTSGDLVLSTIREKMLSTPPDMSVFFQQPGLAEGRE